MPASWAAFPKKRLLFVKVVEDGDRDVFAITITPHPANTS